MEITTIVMDRVADAAHRHAPTLLAPTTGTSQGTGVFGAGARRRPGTSRDGLRPRTS